MDYKGDNYYIDKILNGERDAFSHIVERYKDSIFSLAHKICGSYEDAEEVAQDSFVKAFRSLHNFARKSSFKTWLYRITYNTSISHLRKNNIKHLKLEEFPADAVDFLRDSDSEELAEREYRSAILNFAIQKLGSDDRALISMHYFQELDLNEIEEITGIGKSNLKVKLFRARKRIENILVKNREKSMYYENA